MESIEDKIFETCQDRTTLERIKNLEQKIQPKIDNNLKLLEEGIQDSAGQLKSGILDESDSDNSEASEASETGSGKDSAGDDEEIDSDEFGGNTDDEDTANAKKSTSKSSGGEKSGVYKISKLNPTPYPHDRPSKKQEQEEKSAEKNRKKAFNSSKITDLLDEFSSAPTEHTMKGANTLSVNKMNKIMKDQSRRKLEEEDNYKRFSLTKKQKNLEEKAMTRNEFESLTTFGDVDDLLGNQRYQAYMKNSKQGKKGGNKRKGGKVDMPLLFNKKKGKRR